MGRDNRPDYDISASRVKTYVSCPEKYRLKYIEGKDEAKPKNGYATAGLLVHESIEWVLENHPEESNRGRIESLLKQEFFKLEDDKFSDEVENYVSDKQRDDALKCVETAARYLSKMDYTLREVEAGALFHINHDAVDATAIGYMDVATKNPNEIWDWKTGRIRGDETARDEKIQGAMYMGAYKYRFGEVPDAIKFIYLKEEKVRQLDPSHENWQEMVRYTAQLMDGLENDEYPAKPGGQCYWCDYEPFCDASPPSVGQLRGEILDGNTEMWEAF